MLHPFISARSVRLPRHDVGDTEQTRELDLKLSEAVMLAGGFFAARLLSDGASGEARVVPGDGGFEASPIGDGVRS